MSHPLSVEIIAYAPTAFYHCMHCEVAWREMGKSNRVQQEQIESSLPGDLAQDYLALSDWVRNIFAVNGDRLMIKVIDAVSIEGVYKSLRYGAHRYPVVIVDQHTQFSGENSLETATKEIDRLLTGQELVFRPE
jgi:hypothetical protein